MPYKHWVVWAGILACQYVYAAELPAGHVLEVRLTTGVSSDRSKPGDAVTAELISPVAIDGKVLIAPGALLHGTVKKAAALGFGLKRGRASLAIGFHELCLPSGARIPLRMDLVKVDNAREEIDSSGDVNGISPAVSVSSALAAYAWRLVWLDPPVGAAVWAVKFALAPAPDPEVRLPVGTEILVRAVDSVEHPAFTESDPLRALEVEESDEWRRWLESTPLRIVRKSGEPGDRINLVFAGEAAAIRRAFEASGWSVSEKRTAVSLAKTYFHIVQRKGYTTGPMSPMSFEGHDPAFTFQKTLNTYARRHHLRIWRAGSTTFGSPLWAVAATEDIDIRFSKAAKNWTHEIDGNIDNERAKVVSDLFYTGCVEAASLIAVAPVSSPEFVTDGAVAGLRFNSCHAPRKMAAVSRRSGGNKFYRTVKAIYRDAVRSNFGQIAVTGAHVPPQAFASKPEPQDHRGAWAQQQVTLLNRSTGAE